MEHVVQSDATVLNVTVQERRAELLHPEDPPGQAVQTARRIGTLLFKIGAKWAKWVSPIQILDDGTQLWHSRATTKLTNIKTNQPSALTGFKHMSSECPVSSMLH